MISTAFATKEEPMENVQAYGIIKKMQNGVAVSDAEMRDYNAMHILHLYEMGIQSLDGVKLPEGLQSLDLSGTQISSLDGVKLPEGLQSLGLDYTQISSLDGVKLPEGLQSLDLDDTQISSLDGVKLPEGLQSLDLSGTQISSLDGVKLPKGLQRLNLSDTQISSLDSVTLPEGLQHLFLFRTQISSLDSVTLPEGLQWLDLSHTHISSLDGVKLPEGLQKLNLWHTPISSLDNVKLPEGLQQLNLYSTQISSLDRVMLPEGLQELNLSVTQISSLDSVTLPKGLQDLDLSDTQISSLDSVTLPEGLKTIVLKNLRLKSIPRSLVDTGLPFIDEEYSYIIPLAGIYLKGTELTEQDISLFRRDRATIEAHYRDLEANTERQLNECKVILLGDGEVGKTYIIDRISNNNEKLPENHKTDTTKGILLSTVQTADGESIESDASKFNDTDLKIRFWDFGGQQIMHSMHRCFLTSKTIYVIVVSGRQNELTEKVHYWLTTVAAFAKDSPVIVVTNKSDQYRGSYLDRSALKNDFPNIREFIRFSALTSEKAVFAELSQKIFETAKEKMMFSYQAEWLRLKDKLEHMNDDYIADDEYCKKCNELGINDRLTQEGFLNWFHELSIMFRCPGKRDALGNDYMVLKPQWLINAIYSIICSFDDDKSEERNGQISHSEILDVLKDSSKNADPNYKGQYNNDTVRYIIRVMHAFGISYELRPEWEFIPTLCRKEKPDIAYEFDNDRTLKFLLRYSYLPENVLYRFMIKRKEHLDIKNAWYHGALFDEKNGCRYIVSQDYGDGKGEILIRINTTGDTDAQMVLGEIVTAIRGINEQIGLSAEEYIVYSEAGKDYPVDYNDLWTQKNSGKELTWIKELKGERRINDVLKCAVRDEVIDFIGRKTERDDRIPFEVYKNTADALKTAIETIKAQNETIVAQQETINSQQKFFEKSLEEMSQLLEEYEQSGGRPKSGWLSKVRGFFTGLHNTIGGMLDNGNKALEFMKNLAAVYALYSLVQK